jgi:hypothetical protein
MRRQAAARLGPADRAMLAMRLAGRSPNEIAETVGITRTQPDSRFAGILAERTGSARREEGSDTSHAHVA